MKAIARPTSRLGKNHLAAVFRPSSAGRWFHPRLERLENRCLLSITPATVVGEFLFYDHSKYDGNVSGISASDDQAIASDKSALMSGAGAATFANISSYSLGINGLMVDIAGAHGTITTSDFIFQVGNHNSPATWVAAPSPTALLVRAGAGLSGSDRVEIVWADNAIQKQWLKVTVAANINTGLAASNVFFYGNALANSGLGDTATLAKVDANDEIGARYHPKSLLDNIPPTDTYDYNRDGKVDANDQILSRSNGTSINATKYLSLPAISPPVLGAALANDTGPDGIPNSDGITTDSTVGGSLTGANTMTSFLAGLNSGPVATNALPLVQIGGSFTLNTTFLETLNGGPLADGNYTLNLQAVDSQGLSAAYHLPFTLKRSIATPALPDLITADDTGASSTDNLTKINAPRIDVTAEAGSLVRLLVDNVQVAQGAANPTIQFTLPVQANGSHQIKAISLDGAGNSATSATLSISISTVLPTVTALTTATFTDDLTPHVTVTASDPLGLANGTQVTLDVDLNNNGSFSDANETARTLSTLYNGGSYFQLTPALAATDPLAGPYTVQLRVRVTDAAGNEGVSPLRSLRIDTLGNDVLKNYVQAADPTYAYSLNSTIVGSNYTDYIIDMKSQTWRSSPEVNKPLWQHWLQIIVPTGALNSSAILLIDGGSNSSTPPTSANSTLVSLATQFHSVTIDLPTVPNEPLIFNSDGIPRSEDGIIAYSFNQYLTHLGDPNYESWPALLPMVKSAVRAMDTAQAFVPTKVASAHIDDFLVTGYSKRGWTTWLTAAVDTRVKAVIPGVIDMLNLDEQMVHHYGFYGFFAPTLNDYVTYSIPQNVLTTSGEALMRVVDPYRYLNNGRFDTMPKLLLNSSGDEFFVPDSGQFYFSDIPGTKNYVRYIPNTGHGLDATAVANSTASFYDAVLNNRALPQFSWTVEQDGSIHVHSTDAPTSVLMWQATNSSARDFRRSVTGISYTSSTLTDQGGGNYVASVPTPATGATAFFVQLTFPSALTGNPYIFTTEIKVVSNLPLVAWPFYAPAAPLPAAGPMPDFSAVAFSLASPAVLDNASTNPQLAPAISATNESENDEDLYDDVAQDATSQWSDDHDSYLPESSETTDPAAVDLALSLSGETNWL